MCWKYEDNYKPCFDWLHTWAEKEYGIDNTLVDFLEKWDIKTNKEIDLIRLFFDFLSNAHEKKIIEPLKKPHSFIIDVRKKKNE